MGVTIDQIKDLRDKTSAGMGLCKEALEKSKGDMDKAIEYVNKRSDVISRLYNQTGAKIGHCKLAYEEAGQDFEKAVEIIKERGWEEDVSDSAAKVKREGILGFYVHGVDQKTAAVVELFCDTDFVAKNEKFQNLAKELAMQVAAMNPKYASKESVPEEVIKEEKKVISKSDDIEGKPDDVVEKIVDGKMNKFYQENCLLEQNYFRDDSVKVSSLVDDARVKLGEKIEVGRIYRIGLGE
ncbi:elongation factor Ts [Candidatus Dojkabacteria bacterium]|nr:elongation factor Ts [Candidatus Dojkabacteria bacterium]